MHTCAPVCAQITGRQNAACSFCACMYATYPERKSSRASVSRSAQMAGRRESSSSRRPKSSCVVSTWHSFAASSMRRFHVATASLMHSTLVLVLESSQQPLGSCALPPASRRTLSRARQPREQGARTPQVWCAPGQCEGSRTVCTLPALCRRGDVAAAVSRLLGEGCAREREVPAVALRVNQLAPCAIWVWQLKLLSLHACSAVTCCKRSTRLQTVSPCGRSARSMSNCRSESNSSHTPVPADPPSAR